MLSKSIYSVTYSEAIFCMLLWLIAFCYQYRLVNNSRLCFRKTKFAYAEMFLFFTVYATFEFAGGDFYHYWETYDNYFITHVHKHLEEYYFWLMDILPHNYFVWRFAIWCPAVFLWVFMVKHLKQNAHLAFVFLMLVPLYNFVGARQQMGFSCLYLGISLMLYKNEDTFRIKAFSSNWIIGMIFVLSSLIFHKSMLLYISIFLVSLIPFKKKTILITLILYPFLWISLDYFVDYFVLNVMSMNEQGMEHTINFLKESEQIDVTVFGWIRTVIDKFPIWILLALLIRGIFLNKDGENIPYVQQVFLRMTYLLIYAYALFLGKDVSVFLAPRFWDAALLPMAIVLTYYFHGRDRTILFNFCFMLLFMSKLYTYLYCLYCIGK